MLLPAVQLPAFRLWNVEANLVGERNIPSNALTIVASKLVFRSPDIELKLRFSGDGGDISQIDGFLKHAVQDVDTKAESNWKTQGSSSGKLAMGIELSGNLWYPTGLR